MARILVVDDEPRVREFCRRALENAGYLVDEAPNGRVALRVFEQEPADLVVCDLYMPEMDGFETMREFLRLDARLKIIATSGERSFLKPAGFLGALLVLEKPFTAETLLNAVAEVLRNPE